MPRWQGPINVDIDLAARWSNWRCDPDFWDYFSRADFEYTLITSLWCDAGQGLKVGGWSGKFRSLPPEVRLWPLALQKDQVILSILEQMVGEFLKDSGIKSWQPFFPQPKRAEGTGLRIVTISPPWYRESPWGRNWTSIRNLEINNLQIPFNTLKMKQNQSPKFNGRNKNSTRWKYKGMVSNPRTRLLPLSF